MTAPNTYRAFRYIEGVTRTHLAVWTGDRWKVPCGLITTSQVRPATYTMPLCATCEALTTHYPEEATR